jgi:hypothetical protein
MYVYLYTTDVYTTVLFVGYLDTHTQIDVVTILSFWTTSIKGRRE